jgi:uncharacterized protein (DUF885 family)
LFYGRGRADRAIEERALQANHHPPFPSTFAISLRRGPAGLALATLLLLGACRVERRRPPFDELAREFVFTALAMSPVTATGAGYHVHQGVRLDELLDDYSEAGLERQRLWYRAFDQRLRRDIDSASLSTEQQADLEILRHEIGLKLLDLDVIRNYRRNPTLYVELIGTALFDPFVREYAPKAERFRHIIARLRRVPALLDQARENLAGAPEIWTRVAREENEGNIALIDRTLREAAPPQLRAAYDEAAAPALAALKAFNDWLARELGRRPADWRLGADLYRRKFRLALATSAAPEAVLADAEAALGAVRSKMLDLSLALDSSASKPAAGDPERLNEIVARALARIAARHATRETYFAEARRDLEEATRFVRQKGLVSLAGVENLELIETPEFMRGIYSVGGFNPAPPLEPHLGAYYWLTPIPPDWPPERVESKLREYNYYGLKLLTLHEAMPGHYVQFEYANRVQPESRRLLRSLYGNGPYIEGWAVYATEAMLDAGYLNGRLELRLTFLKQQLRMIANAILDIRLHTLGMSEQEALDLMIRDTFQEREEAIAKLRRAQLSSCQLPTYFVGWREWHRVRELYRRRRGAAFDLAEFHNAALAPGAVPLPVLAALLTGEPPTSGEPGGAPSR